MAHAALGRIYADLDQSDLSAASVRRAWGLRDRTSDRERFFIAPITQFCVTGNLEEARQTNEALGANLSRTLCPTQCSQGYDHKAPGRSEKAAQKLKRPSSSSQFWDRLLQSRGKQRYLNRLDERKTSFSEPRTAG